MDKIICDICGTRYPCDTECCPICGCTNAAAGEILNEDMLLDEVEEEVPAVGKKKEIFDFDEVNSVKPAAKVVDEDEEDDDDEDDEDDEDEDEPRHNSFVVILLTVIIVALLAAAGFIFVRYFLPNMGEETVPTTTVQEVETEAPTTEPTIPCQQMAMTNAGIAELSAEGQQFLLHVKALPENTTDKIVYTSADESIATVTEDGKITAVAEGETFIQITCGKTSMKCPVIVKFVEETVPVTTEAVVDETESVDATEETAETEAVEETEAATETEGNTELKDIKLKLKKTDIQLGVYYSFRLELDCDLDPEDVTWTSEHPHIATVDATGSVKALKAGTTSITAKYGDQEVKCMVRCIWY